MGSDALYCVYMDNYMYVEENAFKLKCVCQFQSCVGQEWVTVCGLSVAPVDSEIIYKP